MGKKQASGSTKAKRQVSKSPKIKKLELTPKERQNRECERKIRAIEKEPGWNGEVSRAYAKKCELMEKMELMFAKGITPPKELSSALMIATWDVNLLADGWSKEGNEPPDHFKKVDYSLDKKAPKRPVL